MMYLIFLLCLLAMAIARFRGMPRQRRDDQRWEEHDGGDSPCQWWRDTQLPSQGVMSHWRCAACNADGYTIDGKPPQRCKRGIDEPVV